jgi:hypothetical protein
MNRLLRISRLAAYCGLFAFAVGCQATHSTRATVTRSPSLDYDRPPPTTADGQTIGANAAAPDDQLQQGLRIGNKSSLAPGWKLNRSGLTYDPRQRVGGATYVQTTQSKSP